MNLVEELISKVCGLVVFKTFFLCYNGHFQVSLD